jgi:excisionase family DNA binding protein
VELPSAIIQAAVPEVLTIRESAEVLRCSKTHVQNLLAGKIHSAPALPYIPMGRRKLIRRESLMRWLKQAEGVTQ